LIFTKLTSECCWICGTNEGLSGEHKIKKSDLKKTPDNLPGILKGYKGQEKPIQGLNSKLLKFDNSICATCNNQKTQQADRSYDEFRDHSTEKIMSILNKTADAIDIAEVSDFNNAGRLELARYFAKHIGCQIDHNKFPIPCRLSRFVNREIDKACVSVKIRLAPWLWQDSLTGDLRPLNGVGGIVLVFTGNVISLPSYYQTAYMTGGLQFIVTMKLNKLEALDIWIYHSIRMGKAKPEISNERAKHLGFPFDN